MYKPNPIDTTKITLSSDIIALGEVLAKNTHEVWAVGRIADGWTHGDVRDDLKKKHPCLVPYEELSESEKDYDRATATETLKVIMSLGYAINKKDDYNLFSQKTVEMLDLLFFVLRDEKIQAPAPSSAPISPYQ